MSEPHVLEEIIRRESDDDSVVFIFPSDIAATLWLEEALRITGRNTLPTHRFIAWDRFKEQAVQASVEGKMAVSAVLRKLYAIDLTERNKASSPSLFTALIPSDFSESGAVFASWIARLLPQLEVWKEKTTVPQSYIPDVEDRDLAFLKADYLKFLDINSLFEPSWQKPPLADTGNRFYVFFPEAIEDYGEYAALFGSSPFITTVPVPLPLDGEPPAVRVFETIRDELKNTALEICGLLEKGVSCTDIAVSVPDAENLAPYLLREFTLRGIPFEYRAGEILGERPAGRLFALIQNCVTTGFSFASVKALLLDRLIPWKDRKACENLVRFGIRNHCVTSWTENGTRLDIWEEAFKTPARGESGDRELWLWYRNLRQSLIKMTTASDFTSIRNGYFIFRQNFIDSTLYSPEDDAVVARCVEELNALSGLEKTFRPYIPTAAYSFFISVLNEKKYVAQRAHRGVSIYPYRVAAGTPYAHHFILDASQESTTVLYRQLPFLRPDKRLALNIREDDASAAFFNMYRSSPLPFMGDSEISTGARFSFSDRSFSGYRTPHGYFRIIHDASAVPNDPFAEERRWFAGKKETNGDARGFPQRLYRSQKDGFQRWRKLDVEKGFTYLTTPYGKRLPSLSALVRERQMDGEDLRVSQTDLAIFSQCNARWFLGKILQIKAVESDAELLNERNLGILYHDVLKNVYGKIHETDTVFMSSRIEEYCAWAEEFAGKGASEHAEFRGPLAAPLIASLVRKIADGVAGMIQSDAKLLDGFIPEFLEKDISLSRNGVRYYGKIDRISRRSADNTTVLIDYKSGKTPMPAQYICDEQTHISDFQIPMYVFLAEEAEESPYHGSKIEEAWFGTIKDGNYRPIINNPEAIKFSAKRGMVTREEFEKAMESFQEMTADFADAVQEENFTRPAALAWQECIACDFQKICRFTYAVRP